MFNSAKVLTHFCRHFHSFSSLEIPVNPPLLVSWEAPCLLTSLYVLSRYKGTWGMMLDDHSFFSLCFLLFSLNSLITEGIIWHKVFLSRKEMRSLLFLEETQRIFREKNRLIYSFIVVFNVEAKHSQYSCCILCHIYVYPSDGKDFAINFPLKRPLLLLMIEFVIFFFHCLYFFFEYLSSTHLFLLWWIHHDLGLSLSFSPSFSWSPHPSWFFVFILNPKQWWQRTDATKLLTCTERFESLSCLWKQREGASIAHTSFVFVLLVMIGLFSFVLLEWRWEK